MNAKWIGLGAGMAGLGAAAFFALESNRDGEHQAMAVRSSPAQSEEGSERTVRREREPAPRRVTSPQAKAAPPREDAVDASNGELAVDPAQELEELRAESLSELRLPVIQAIRADYASDSERKEGMLAALRASGSTNEPWAAEGNEVFEGWARAIPQEVRSASLKETVACYRAGCEIAVRFASHEEAERAAEAFRRILEPEARHGGRIQTPAVDVGGGAYEASWIMLRPS